LAGCFLFDLDQSNICVEIYKKDRKIDKKLCIYLSEIIQNNKKRLQTPNEVEKYFPGFMAFRFYIEQQQIPRPADKKRRKRCILFKKEKKDIL